MTNASDDTSRPGEMTDEQLDQLLKTASTSLLDHITATADPSRTLTAIMDHADQQAPAESPVSVVIRFRDTAHDLVSALALVSTSFDSLDRASALIRGLSSALIPDLASDPVRVLERIHNLGRTRSLVTALAQEIEHVRYSDQQDYIFDPVRVDRRVRGPLGGRVDDCDLGLDPLGRALDQDRVDDRDLPRASAPVQRRGGERGLPRRRRVLPSAHDSGGDRDFTLSGALDQARAIAQDLDSIELDASGEDLSGIEIRHLDAVDGITWTRETTWPPAITADIEENSYEIQPGVYRVRLGDIRARHMLLTLA